MAGDTGRMQFVKSKIREMVRLPLMRSALGRKPALIVLLYHGVDPSPPDFLARCGIITSPDDFAAHLRWIARDFEMVSLSEGVRRLRTDELKRTAFAVTFDDGLRSVAEHALPILREYRSPCTMFINRTSMECGRIWQYSAAWLEDRGETESLAECFGQCAGAYLKFLRWSAPGELLSRGSKKLLRHRALSAMPNIHLDHAQLSLLQHDPLVEIGNHGSDHLRFSMIDPAEQRNQIAENHEALRGFENYRRLFAVPFGKMADWNLQTVAASASADHEFITAQGGVNLRGQAGVDIKRIPCDALPGARLEEHLVSVGMGVL